MKKIASYGLIVTVLAITGIAVLKMPGILNGADSSNDAQATYVVQRRTIEDRVVERGTIESQKTVYGKCEIPGRNKITFIVPEGSRVKKGDKVAEFETTEIDKDIKEKEVEINEAKGKHAEAVQSLSIKEDENATNIAAAKLAFDIAEIDLKKYRLGDFESEKADLNRAIKEAEAELEKVRDEKNNIKILVKKGYRTPQQLLEYQLREQNFQFQVERDKQKYKVLVTYDRDKKLIEFGGKVEETKLKLERAKKTAKAETLKAQAAIDNAASAVSILEQQLEELQRLRKKCTLLAEQDGTVAYANERWYDASERIREGTEVYSGRNVYFLPDMSRMQVKANVHESVVDKIKVDQTADIRLDAFSDRKLAGRVTKVAGMAASSYSSVQNYETIIVIDQLPDELDIKPGMTAEVNILVGTYEDVITVPVGAVTEHFEQSYVYVRDGGSISRRSIETGRSTHSFVEVLEGLREGETVTLDAYQRGIDDFADAEQEAGAGGAAPSGAPQA
ncbi:efflux RND transporter periplasmic adaptor subunit [Roseiconus lacunae]|uniref:Efflux RND transporter periplasmic adaptor subunit n=1 Tax=Roseiconus lacunae TaxID=2605694 RepID=A0ABT7PQX6_9BACT|nr:efflux RND transporter periplasmic adaptor subunit [Roseiconus lacunae]MDM4018888.1 efflux RND transporter periplasmic adaptor subunit [Roseiconus lacunae]WRQ49154.1 efflux RND transporter periplasmic adaptor subunit [Stieleria sp. HD01]